MSKELPPKQSREVVRLSEAILATFMQFGVEMKLVSAKEGLRAYHFELEMVTAVRMKLIEGFLDDLKYALSTSKIFIAAPIPDKKLIGIEVAKSERPDSIPLKDVLSHPEYVHGTPLTVPLGVDEFGAPSFIDLVRTPHLLIGGTTGSGKSTLLHTFITSLIKKNAPDKLRLILIDPKRVEFVASYNSLQHLLTPVIVESKKAVRALAWANKEMERRYDILETEKCQNIWTYHKHVYEPALQVWEKNGKKESERAVLPDAMPYIVIMFDEISDIMHVYPKETEAAIVRLAQMSRLIGIHVVIATSRPSVKVISSALKANIPSRIAFSTASYIDSRTLLDQNGAEKLLGTGDMLHLGTEDFTLSRYQGYVIEDEDIRKEVKLAARRDAAETQTLDLSEEPNISYTGFFTDSGDEEDDLYEDAKAAVLRAGKASTSYIQRALRVGYSRAARLMDMLEEKGVIGPASGSEPRQVIK